MTCPLRVTRPIPSSSVNHRLSSGPATISRGAPSAVGIGYSVYCPSVVIRPTPSSVNHRSPSGLAAILRLTVSGRDQVFSELSRRSDPADLVTAAPGEPEVAVRSRRNVIGALSAVGIENSVTCPTEAAKASPTPNHPTDDPNNDQTNTTPATAGPRARALTHDPSLFLVNPSRGISPVPLDLLVRSACHESTSAHRPAHREHSPG